MNQPKDIERIYRKIELITRRWWFLFIFITINTIIPPYASKEFSPHEVGKVTEAILTQAIILSLPSEVYVVFKVVPIILISLIMLIKNKAARLFNVYVAITYILFALLQSIAITEEYGFAVLTGNLVMFMIVSTFWFWESVIHKTISHQLNDHLGDIG